MERNKIQLDANNFFPCKICGKSKRRITHNFGKGGTARWVDEFGKRWNGKVCPECLREENRESIKSRRLLKGLGTKTGEAE